MKFCYLRNWNAFFHVESVVFVTLNLGINIKKNMDSSYIELYFGYNCKIVKKNNFFFFNISQFSYQLHHIILFLSRN